MKFRVRLKLGQQLALRVQMVVIPEFQVIGNAAEKRISETLSGKVAAGQALKNAQADADRVMRKAGYYR